MGPGIHVQIPRKILILPVTAALLAVGVAASISLLYPGLPDPAVADREGLLRWFATRDLRREPMDTRHALAQRFEEEFCTASGTKLSNTRASDTKTNPDWESLGQRLDQSERQQFWDNLAVVLEPWFLEKTDRYHELTEAQRTPYLDRMIDTITVLNGIDAIRPNGGEAGKPSGEGGLYALLLGHVQQWKQNVDPPRRERIDRFLAHMQRRWILRTLGLATTPD